MVRVLGGRDLWQPVQRHCETLLLGNMGASWCVAPEGLSPASLVYCAGVGEEISFDLELIERFGAEVHAFDPTPRSIRWIASRALPDRFVFHDYGLADFDGTTHFHAPENSAYVSHTMLRRGQINAPVAARVHRLPSIMKMLEHSKIDVLKMDIEGAEYAVLADLLASGIRPRQILVEFHHRWPEIGPAKTRASVRALNEAGYSIFHVSPSGEEFSFCRNPQS